MYKSNQRSWKRCYNLRDIFQHSGLTYGKYKRYTDYLGLDNHYEEVWWDPVKLRYDYTIHDRIRLGAIFSLTGEDGDGSTYIGVLLGYKF